MNLSAVVRLIGINENTLRAWERRYDAVTPARDANGRRFYSDKEVEKIQLLWALVSEGHSIGSIAQFNIKKLKSMLNKSLSPLIPAVESINGHADKYLANIIRSIKSFNLEVLHQNLQRARFDLSIKEIILHLIRPLMEQVGRMSEVGSLNIAEEHLLSSLLRDYLGNVHQSLSPYDFNSRKESKSVFITTREGDLHEFNILMAAILCNVYQFKTFYLGANMPVDDLAKSCLKYRPDYLILGLTELTAEREIISPAKYLVELDKRLPRIMTFCCGGAKDSTLELLSKDRKIIKVSSLSDLDQFLASKSKL